MGLAKGSFNNYVDKKRYVGGQDPYLVIRTEGRKKEVYKMSIIVHSSWVGGLNWVKFGPRSC